MKKRALLIVLGATVILTLSVTACGSKQDAAAQTETVIETETAEVVAEVTEEPETEEIVVETTELPAETETEEIIAEVTEEPETEEIAVKEMSATKYAKSSVNVRKGPGTDYDKVGSLSTNQQVAVTGQADSGWYRIDMNGEAAYVSNKYLSDEKVTVNTAKNNTSAGTANNSGADAGNGAQQPQTPPANNNAGNNNAGAQQPSQPQTPPVENNTQPSQPQTPPADNNNTSSEWTQEELEKYYGDTGFVGGATATPEQTQEMLENLPDGAFNVQVDENGGVTCDLPKK